MKTSFLRCCIFGFSLLISNFVFGQVGQTCDRPTANSPFPINNPNIGEMDSQANRLNYYFAHPINSTCLTDNSTNSSCARDTYQYAFGRAFPNDPFNATTNYNRVKGDGNSEFLIFYSTESNGADCQNGKPLAVIIHGGSGSKDNDMQVALGLEYARRGYVAIVPDYTTGADSLFGVGNVVQECRNERQTMFTIQYAIMDIRAAIRRALYISTLSSECAAKIDPSRIFLHGNSNGSITSIHLALMEASDFTTTPLDPVLIKGVNRTFSNNLDRVRICSNMNNATCMNFNPYAGGNLRLNIKGLALNAGFVIREDLITSTYNIPTILFHGTCDASAPYHTATAKQATYIKTETVPNSVWNCQFSTDMNFMLFGSNYIYEKLKSFHSNSSTFNNVVFMSFCGLGHAVQNKYGLLLGPSPKTANNIGLQPAIYETFRFFAYVLNNQVVPSLRFDLDHSLRQVNIVDCNAVPSANDNDLNNGEYYTGLDILCSRCLESSTVNPNLRNPFFRNNPSTDPNRYAPLSDFLASCGYCSTSGISEQHLLGAENIDYSIRIMDVFGKEQKIISTKNHEISLNSVLSLDHGLEKGFYFIHLPNGEKRSVVIQ